MKRFLGNFLFGVLLCVAFVSNPASLQAASTWETVTASVREADPASNQLVVDLTNEETGVVRVLSFTIDTKTKWIGVGGLSGLQESDKVQVDFSQGKNGVFIVSRLNMLEKAEPLPQSSADEGAEL